MAARKQTANRPRSRNKPSGGDTAFVEDEVISALTAKISDLATAPKPDFFALANALSTCRTNYPKAFASILKTVGISRRRAYYLFEIHERYEPFMRDAARLRAIGWTKLRALAPLISHKNAAELLSLAEAVNAHRLMQILDDKKAPATPHCVLLRLTPDQYRLYKAAILTHGGKRRGRQLIDQERALLSIIDRASACSK